MRILFLDDNMARHKWAYHNLCNRPTTTHYAATETAAETIGCLEKSGDFDVVYLDHDLGDETFVDSSRPDTGMEVVRWVVENKPKVGRFVVHSLNTPAANEMVAKLREAGYEADYVSFLVLCQQGA